MLSKNICCIAPFTETSDFFKLTRDLYGKFKDVQTVGVKYAKEIPQALADFAYAVPGVIEKAKEKEAEGYNGIIIGCLSDTGYEEAKEVVRISVVGPLHASLVLAHMSGDRFSVVLPDELLVTPIEKLIKKYSFLSNLASIRCVSGGITNIECTAANDEIVKNSVGKIIECIEKDRANSVILGCLSMIPMVGAIRKAITPKYPIAVINPVDASYYMVEMLRNFRTLM